MTQHWLPLSLAGTGLETESGGTLLLQLEQATVFDSLLRADLREKETGRWGGDLAALVRVWGWLVEKVLRLVRGLVELKRFEREWK